MPRFINRNLLVVQELLKRLNRNESTVCIHRLRNLHGNDAESWKILTRLEAKKAIEFETWADRNHLEKILVGADDDIGNAEIGILDITPIRICLKKDGLDDFKKKSEDAIYGIDQCEKDMSITLDALYYALRVEPGKEIPREISKRYEVIYEWIADYSGAIKRSYDFGEDFDFDESGQPISLSAYITEKGFVVASKTPLKKMNRIIRKRGFVSRMEIKSLLSENNNEIKWRCANPSCNKFLEKIIGEDQIVQKIKYFSMGGTKRCRKCNKKNYFLINPSGKIKFY